MYILANNKLILTQFLYEATILTALIQFNVSVVQNTPVVYH